METLELAAYDRGNCSFAGLTPHRIFILILLCSSVSLLLWAGTSKVDVIVRTVGQIIPAGKSQIVQHLEGGIVRKILVREGQVVAAGEPLIELADVQTRSNLGTKQSKLNALRGREARLFAELNGSDRIDFPEDLKDSDVIRVETAAWKARLAQLSEESQVLQALSRQKKSELAEMNSKQKNLLQELVLAQQKHHVIEDLSKNNAASELEVLDSQMHIQRLKSQISDALSAVPRLEAAISEAESRIKEASARFRAEASATLTQIQEEIEKLNPEIDTSVDRLERNIVRSPVAGLINKLNVTTVGAVVRPSEILLEITPSDQRIVIETRSNPDDRAHLRRNLPARVRIGAYDYSTYGTFDGHVTEVSADTLTDERGNRYYRVNVEVDVSTLISRVGQAGVLMPGMAASADIAVGKRTILSYLLSPVLEFRDGAFRAN
ncbi:MAG: HlyD family type I secretion periplasmic adaptor subunit [Proteobacteria bacterium]|nr:HlyD family type I secretion periplasmic adaptor subunit [Pseudomonadota bacterium]MBU1739735.1 HlyD family type I secretion periplasmic adaptor subunit [Pseudomonadota bacterium]